MHFQLLLSACSCSLGLSPVSQQRHERENPRLNWTSGGDTSPSTSTGGRPAPRAAPWPLVNPRVPAPSLQRAHTHPVNAAGAQAQPQPLSECSGHRCLLRHPPATSPPSAAASTGARRHRGAGPVHRSAGGQSWMTRQFCSLPRQHGRSHSRPRGPTCRRHRGPGAGARQEPGRRGSGSRGSSPVREGRRCPDLPLSAGAGSKQALLREGQSSPLPRGFPPHCQHLQCPRGGRKGWLGSPRPTLPHTSRSGLGSG